MIKKKPKQLSFGFKERKTRLPVSLRSRDIPKLRDSHNLKIKNLKQKFEVFGAKDEARTRDNQLGRLELYQLSYFRIITVK